MGKWTNEEKKARAMEKNVLLLGSRTYIMALWVNAPMERILLLAILHEVHRQTQKCEWPPETHEESPSNQ